MSRFLTPLRIEPSTYKDSGEWMLVDEFRYYSELVQDTIVVPPQFITDLNSTPRIIGLFELFGSRYPKSSVVHDLLYSTHQYQRHVADRIFMEAALVEGAAKWRVMVMYFGLRLFGINRW